MSSLPGHSGLIKAETAQAALSAEFKAAVPAYEEKPRTKWIFENSVQTTITVSRTFFTQEVNEAFGDMEDGNEDALKVPLLISLLLLECPFKAEKSRAAGTNALHAHAIS